MRTLTPRSEPDFAPLTFARWAFAALAISIGVIVAHGCHKADADHEPAAATPLADELPPP